MAIGVGLRIGRIVSTAVVASNEPGTPDPVVIARDTVLHIDHDGNSQLGGSTRTIDEARTLSGFLSRVGDPGGIAASDGRVYRAEDAMATAVHCLLNECHPLPTFGGMDHDTHPATPPPTRRIGIRRGSRCSAPRSTTQNCGTWTSSPTPGRCDVVRLGNLRNPRSAHRCLSRGRRRIHGHAGSFRCARRKSLPCRRQGCTSPAAQLATALGAFGWMPHNLDAVVVMGDGSSHATGRTFRTSRTASRPN